MIWQPTPVFLPGKSFRHRSLTVYSPWDHKESDTTNHACTHTRPALYGFPDQTADLPQSTGDPEDGEKELSGLYLI